MMIFSWMLDFMLLYLILCHVQHLKYMHHEGIVFSYAEGMNFLSCFSFYVLIYFSSRISDLDTVLLFLIDSICTFWTRALVLLL